MKTSPSKPYVLKTTEELEAAWMKAREMDETPVDWDLEQTKQSIVDFFKAGPGVFEGDGQRV